MAGNINTAHQAGFGLDGSTGRDFFAVVGHRRRRGAAAWRSTRPSIADPARIAAAASAATLPGDASNLQALIATEYLALPRAPTPARPWAASPPTTARDRQRRRAMSEQDGAILDHLQEMRESVGGVSIDEELINLTKSQRAFEAVMKVITTADDMLETLMSLR